MKTIRLLILTFCIAVPFFMAEVQAFEIGAGLYSYYNWRDMPISGIEDYKQEPVLQIGPVLNLTFFKNFGLTFSVLSNGNMFTDKYYFPTNVNMTFSNAVLDESTGNYVKVRAENLMVNKTDADLALSYILSDIKLFCGVKFLFSEIKALNTDWVTTNIATGEVKRYSYDFEYSNPIYRSIYAMWAVGGSSSIPLVNNFFLMPNISILYGNADKEVGGEIKYWSNVIPPYDMNHKPIANFEKKGSYRVYGTNLVLGLSYFITPISTVLTIGGRYQAMYSLYKSGEYKGSDKDLEQVWGITVSAMAFVGFFED